MRFPVVYKSNQIANCLFIGGMEMVTWTLLSIPSILMSYRAGQKVGLATVGALTRDLAHYLV